MIALVLAASVAPSGQPDGWLTPGGISIVIGALGGFALIMLRDKVRGVRITGDSEMTTKEQPPTRREFDRLEATMNTNFTAYQAQMNEGLIRLMGVMESSSKNADKRFINQNATLSRKIEEVAAGAYQARNRMHVTINEQGQRLARVEERTDIFEKLDKVVDAITSSAQTRVQPTHISH